MSAASSASSASSSVATTNFRYVYPISSYSQTTSGLMASSGCSPEQLSLALTLNVISLENSKLGICHSTRYSLNSGVSC